MKYKVILDSCGELLDEWKGKENFVSVPLTLNVNGEEIIDDETFNQKSFLKKVAESPVCPKSACPSPERYYKEYDCGAERIYVVTLSAELSGSYNSAMLAKSLFEESHPGGQIHVFNSRSASVGETLIGMKIQELEERGLAFEDVIRETESYIDSQDTYFVLENLDSLRKNGRLTGVKALVATALKIKPIMGSTDEGKICQLDQVRGINRALVRMMELIVARTVDGQHKIMAIANCNCRERAEMFREAIQEKLRLAKVIILDTAGVSSLYACDGGIIVVV